MIVSELQRILHRCGYIPRAELLAFSDRSGIPLYRLQEVASFFPHFKQTPPAAVEIEICRDLTCHLRGSRELAQELRQAVSGAEPGQINVTEVSCLARCDRAPACRMNGHSFLNRSVSELRDIAFRLAEGTSEDHPDSDWDWVPPLAEQWKIDIYNGRPIYRAVRRFIASDEPNEEAARILDSLKEAGLLGMGGAGGRAAKKWQDVREAVGTEKYVVCNGDESEPGTFKDREILLRMPHLVLEGMILGGLVVGATRGYVYIRHEFEEQIAAVEQAIRAAEQLGVCGENILGSNFSFHLEVFVSPGGYICGEQTALIEAMEDRRAEPRNRPPQLQTNGLRDKPTLLNNVETLAWVPSIVEQEDGLWFAGQGVAGCNGRRFFSVSGDVARPGPYEVPNGIKLRELIEDYCGGMKDGKPLKAFAPSGPSGGFLPARIPVWAFPTPFVKDYLPEGAVDFDILDMVLDIPMARRMDIMLGAGLVIYNTDADMVTEARSCQHFYRNESCGKCVPCRIGSQKLVELSTSVASRRFDATQLKSTGVLVEEMAEMMRLTSICGLGVVAANPLSSLLRFFPEEVARYRRTSGAAPPSGRPW